MNKIRRYQIRPHADVDPDCKPWCDETDDEDVALIATAVYPVDVWDIDQERYLTPINNDTEYQEVLYRVNQKRQSKIKLKWGDIFFATVLVSILCYCVYVLLVSPS